MLTTAENHFKQDISRAHALRQHARTLPVGSLRDDHLRAAWMMSVGALDAYFSDAYADVISRVLRAKELQPAVAIPDRLSNLKIPVIAVIRAKSNGWRWRMAARELIEDDNVLSLDKIRSLFNQFFRTGYKLLGPDTIGTWIQHANAKKRLFGIDRAAYMALNSKQQDAARKTAVQTMDVRFKVVFQRRHDCIHNCDRPRTALQAIGDGSTSKATSDVAFLVERCHDALLTEFPIYLSQLGFSAATSNQVRQ